ncbi:MAG: phage minor head protein [Marinilabiliaceae bacterium]
MLAEVYRGEWDADALLSSRLLGETRAIFGKAVDKGTPRSTPHRTAFKRSLKTSTDVFSAFRVHRQAADVAALLTGDDGRRTPFGEWAAKAQPYLNHQNRAWLMTEYSTAVRRAHDEADWQRFREDSDIYPNLEWVPSTSAHPGADHKVFWGMVLPVSDPFWSSHRPGDRWNCKCSLRPTDRPASSAPRRAAKADDPQPGLTAKPGSGEVFSTDHPYFPKSCASCPFGGSLRALAASLRGGKRDCNVCPKARKALGGLGENARRARTAANAKRRADLDKWADESLPNVTVGKFKAKRDVVGGIVINKRTAREVFTKNVNGRTLPEVLGMLRNYKSWLLKMTKLRTEPARHHDNALFYVYSVEYGDADYEVKTKVECGEELLYTIKKVEN